MPHSSPVEPVNISRVLDAGPSPWQVLLQIDMLFGSDPGTRRFNLAARDGYGVVRYSDASSFRCGGSPSYWRLTSCMRWRMGFGTLVWRSVRLRCPVCGRGKLFAGWFKMHSRCGVCDAKFEREAGFFLGSIYFNYGLTALVVAIAYPVLLFSARGWRNHAASRRARVHPPLSPVVLPVRPRVMARL